MPPAIKTPNWWKTGAMYQIWPVSYKDSDGDGLGDIPGILTKLDYIKDLGIDTIWLSPQYESPQKDMGYDISNYEAIYPPYGTMEDMDKLIDGVHARGMQIILDLVINHTSDQHAWFQESKESRDNPKADWYIWRDPKIVDGEKCPPNNWGDIFGAGYTSAWEYVPGRDQYYLHLFEKEQPDLDWENPETRRAIYESAIEFWLKKGIDGFRVDTVNLYDKSRGIHDVDVVRPEHPFQISGVEKIVLNGPRMHEFLKEIRKEVLDKYGDVVMVGECAGVSAEDILAYVGEQRRELNLIFDFDIVTVDGNHKVPKHEITVPSLPDIKAAFKKTQDLCNGTDAWTSVFMENHDQARSISRYATEDPQYHDRAGKLLAMLLGTLSGTLFLYQGQEIGMTNVPYSWDPTDLQDVGAVNYWKNHKKTYANDEKMLARGKWGLIRTARDNARTPVQWDDGPNAGFTTGKPWMKINDNYRDINVARQVADPNSIHAFWRRMLKLRKEHSDVFVQGAFELLDPDNTESFTYVKTSEDGKKKAFVLLNFSDKDHPIVLPDEVKKEGKELELLAGNNEKPGKKLSAWEGKVYLVD